MGALRQDAKNLGISARAAEPGNLRQNQTTRQPNHGERCAWMPKPGITARAAEPGDLRQTAEPGARGLVS